ncbi:hypothetical protein CYLTODRAFT_412115 [Cylindrobasidium torrendii FP15055 ss-10]|uniref:Uncharacterized protein n=1 Tax=Cylindrobasidium torrendii FP15055 ss-10 TaxID=1314674 RepID=A0A0D7B780_9AGAR|nr:hypothetical protein CYLTODRAFT_412115 [Cylindrobasidium torrendii FP15055 ss-10]
MSIVLFNAESELFIWSIAASIIVSPRELFNDMIWIAKHWQAIYVVCRSAAYYVQSVQICGAHVNQLKQSTTSSRDRRRLTSHCHAQIRTAGPTPAMGCEGRSIGYHDQVQAIVPSLTQRSQYCQTHSQWPAHHSPFAEAEASTSKRVSSSMISEEHQARSHSGSHPSLPVPSTVAAQCTTPDPTITELTPCLRRRAALNLLLPLIAHGVHYILTPKDDFDKCKSAEAELLVQAEQHTGFSRQRTGELLALDMNEVFDCLATDTQSLSPVNTYLANPETLNYSPMLSAHQASSTAVRCAECQSDTQYHWRRPPRVGEHFEDMLWPVVVAPPFAIPMPPKVCELYAAVCSVFEMPVGTLAVHFRGVMDELLREHLFDHLDVKLLSEMGIDTRLELTMAAKEEARRVEMEGIGFTTGEDDGEWPLRKEASSHTILAAVLV